MKWQSHCFTRIAVLSLIQMRNISVLKVEMTMSFKQTEPQNSSHCCIVVFDATIKCFVLDTNTMELGITPLEDHPLMLTTKNSNHEDGKLSSVGSWSTVPALVQSENFDPKK